MTSATTGSDAPRDSTLRYGVVGTGMMGVEHIENILALDGAAGTAVADPHGVSQEASRRAVVGAGSPNEPLVVDTVEELLAADACDAVVIASPNHTHCDTLLAVLASPLHVMIEKPLCTTIAECRRVVDAAALGIRDLAVDDRRGGGQDGAIGRMYLEGSREFGVPSAPC